MNARTNFISYNRRVFRNFATVTPSQSLVDDLVDQKEEQTTLESLYYQDKTLRSLSPLERSLNRSFDAVVQSEINSKFMPKNWYASRYSDGTWPVLYAAESEETALYEAVFHLREFYKEELTEGEKNVDRRVCSLLVKSNRCIDVLKIPKSNKKIFTSTDRSGYPYCQRLARRSLKSGAEMLRAPSARQPKGTCVAIFDKSVVVADDGHLKYVKLVLTQKNCRILKEESTIDLGYH